jgi:hypothetical protein
MLSGRGPFDESDMAEHVHHHHEPTGGGGAGWVVALLLVVVVAVILWFVFAGGTRETDRREIDIDIQTPEVQTPQAPNVDVGN